MIFLKMLCVEEELKACLKVTVSSECFRESVKILLQTIPVGNVVSYSYLAKILKTHPRNIAKAVKNNDEPIITPCHRVIRENGEVGGYTINGRRLPEFKRKLLLLEGVVFTGDKVGRDFFTRLLE